MDISNKLNVGSTTTLNWTEEDNICYHDIGTTHSQNDGFIFIESNDDKYKMVSFWNQMVNDNNNYNGNWNRCIFIWNVTINVN